MTTTKPDRRNQLIKKLKKKDYRDAFVASHIESGISFQLRRNRTSRGWTQKELGERAGMKQTVISRLEGPDHGMPNIQTLLRLASALDVALVVRFAPFSELVDWDLALRNQSLLVPPFQHDIAVSTSVSWEKESTNISSYLSFIVGRSQLADSAEPTRRLVDFDTDLSNPSLPQLQ